MNIYRDGVVLFRAAHLQNKFEDNTIKYDGKPNTADLNDFITENL